MKDFFNLVKQRRSIRKYKDKAVSNEIIEKLIDTAQWAPSGMNCQPWHFIIIKNKEKLKKIKQMYEQGRETLKIYSQDTSFIEKTIVILVCAKKEFAWAKNDCYFALQNIMLGATELGLGSLCLGALMVPVNIPKLKEMCKIPDNLDIIIPLAVGYPDEKPSSKRKNVKEILHYDEF